MIATTKQWFDQQNARKTLFESESLQISVLTCLCAATADAVAWLYTLRQRDEPNGDRCRIDFKLSCTLRIASFMTSAAIMFLRVLFLIAEPANWLEPNLVWRVGQPAFGRRGRLYVSHRIVRMMQ